MNGPTPPRGRETGAGLPGLGAGSDAVTFVMPVYDRTKFFRHYVAEGFWQASNVQAVCDGSPPEVLGAMQDLAARHPWLRVHACPENRGVARARGTGIALAATPFTAFCDDDDFIPAAADFAARGASVLADDPDALFCTLPLVYAFNERLQGALQYDRRRFDGRTALEVLTWMVQSGEMNLLLSGSLFRTGALRALPVDDFFRVSEDYTLLVRLCARHPEKRVRVLPQGAYMRLLHDTSVAARANYSLDKLLMNLVSMCVGAYYLIETDRLTPADLQQILRRRGDVLQQSYGMGRDAAHVVAALVEGGAPALPSDEARAARAFLDEQEDRLPEEFARLLTTSPVPLQ